MNPLSQTISAGRAALLGATLVLGLSGGIAMAAVTASAGGTAAAEPTAAAESAPLQRVTWFYDDPAASAPVGAATSPATSTGVPAGDVGVGYRAASAGTTAPTAGESDKFALLAFNLASLSADRQVGSFTVTVPVDLGQPSSAATLAAGPPTLVACAVLRLWPGNHASGPQQAVQAPPVECGQARPGKYDPRTSSYTFTVTDLAQQWAGDANTGIAIEPAPATSTPFTLALGPATAVTSSFTTSARLATATPTTSPPALPHAVTPALSLAQPLTPLAMLTAALTPAQAPEVAPAPEVVPAPVISALAPAAPELSPRRTVETGHRLAGMLPYVSVLLIIPLLLLVGLGLAPPPLSLDRTPRSRLAALLDRT